MSKAKRNDRKMKSKCEQGEKKEKKRVRKSKDLERYSGKKLLKVGQTSCVNGLVEGGAEEAEEEGEDVARAAIWLVNGWSRLVEAPGTAVAVEMGYEFRGALFGVEAVTESPIGDERDEKKGTVRDI